MKTKKQTTLIRLISGLILLLVFSTGCNPREKESGSSKVPANPKGVEAEKETLSVNVGVFFPMTGDAASYGEKGKRAIDLALEDIAAEKFGDVKINVIIEDTKADPATGVAAVTKLVNLDKTPAVIGDIVSSVTLAVAPIVERNKVMLLSPTSSAPAITEAGEFVYRIWPSDLAEGKAIAQFAVEQGNKTAGLLHLNNDYGISIAHIFQETFETQSGVVTGVDAYAVETTDFRSVLTKIASGNPDVLYVAGYYADSAAIARQAFEMGIHAQILGTTAIEDEEFIRMAGAAEEGIIYPLATGFDNNSANPKVVKFIQTFKTKYEYDPGWVEAQAYDSLMLIWFAIKQIEGDVTGSAIKQIIDEMESYNGVTGSIRFDENGDVVKPISFKVIKDGAFAQLEVN